jgi:integrase
LEHSPATKVRKNKENSRTRFVESSEAGVLMRAVEAEPTPTIRDFVLMCLYTGLRSENVKEARWERVKAGDGLPLFAVRSDNVVPILHGITPPAALFVPKAEYKTNVDFFSPLIDAAKQLLARRYASRESDTFVFPANSKSGCLCEPKAGWRRITSRAEAYALLCAFPGLSDGAYAACPSLDTDLIDRPVKTLATLKAIATGLALDVSRVRMTDLTIHDLRRTLGSWMGMTGANDVMRKKALGQRLDGIAEVYTRSELAPVHAAMEKALAHFMSHYKSSPLQAPALTDRVAQVA